MLIREGSARTLMVDRRLAWSLAAIAGALDTAAFQEVGFFAANMTGNVSLLSLHIADAAWRNSFLFLSIVAMFIAGAAGSTFLVTAGRRQGHRGVYAYSVLAESILLALLGCFRLKHPGAQSASELILGLSFLMGLQNAVVTQLSNARVRTTHISGMATDIGIELVLIADLRRHDREGADYAQIKSALRLHGETVLSFLGGGVFGIMIFNWIGDSILLVAAALLGGLALKGLLRLYQTPS